MSATSEILIEQLQKLDELIKLAEEQGTPTIHLLEKRRKISEQFSSALQTLNECKTILKG